MLERWAAGVDVVYGQRASREGEGRFKLITAKLFYRLLSRVSNVDIPKDTGDFRVAGTLSLPAGAVRLGGIPAGTVPLRSPGASRRADEVLGAALRWITCLGLLMTMAAFVSGVCLLLVRFLDPGAPFPVLAGAFHCPTLIHSAGKTLSPSRSSHWSYTTAMRVACASASARMDPGPISSRA